jgi:putative hemolysin
MSNLIKTTQKHDHGSAMASTGGSFGMSAFDGSGHTYVARLARRPAELRAAQALRCEVFNLELQEGLASSFATGLDADPFDAVCDHLIAEDRDSEEIVGNYRLQTGLRAALQRGYYSAQEFDFAPFEERRGEILEVGRACIARAHRNLAVLQLLWRGIGFYAHAMGAR